MQDLFQILFTKSVDGMDDPVDLWLCCLGQAGIPPGLSKNGTAEFILSLQCCQRLAQGLEWRFVIAALRLNLCKKKVTEIG